MRLFYVRAIHSLRENTVLCGYTLSVVAMLVITFASLMPRGGIGDPGSADKLAHVLAYAAAAIPATFAKPKATLWIALAILGWSGAIEIFQSFIGRQGSVSDLLANAVGIAAGILIALACRMAVRCMARKSP